MGENWCNFLSNWENLRYKFKFIFKFGMFHVNGDFFSQLGKNFVLKTGPSFNQERRPEISVKGLKESIAEISRTPDSASRDEETRARTHNSAKR